MLKSLVEMLTLQQSHLTQLTNVPQVPYIVFTAILFICSSIRCICAIRLSPELI